MTVPDVVVALETSGAPGSVAVARAGVVVARRFLPDVREHAARAIPALAEALAEAEVERRSIEGIVVGAGPGSFTGVRVAAATGKGLAHALEVPMWAVSSLEAAAVTHEALAPDAAAAMHEALAPDAGLRGRVDRQDRPGEAEPGGLRAVLFDARGRRLYVAAFEGSGAGLEVVQAPAFSTLDALMADPRLARALLCGEAALRHRNELEDAGRRVLDPPAGLPTADGLVRRLRDDPRPALEDPFGWEPDYLRATSAERERPRGKPAVG